MVVFQGVLALSPESRRSPVVRHVDQQGLTVDDDALQFGDAHADGSHVARYPFALVASTTFDLGATIVEPVVAEAVGQGSTAAIMLMLPPGMLVRNGDSNNNNSTSSSAFASLSAMLSSVARRISDFESNSGIQNNDGGTLRSVVAQSSGYPQQQQQQRIVVDAFSGAQVHQSFQSEASVVSRNSGWEQWLDQHWFSSSSSSAYSSPAMMVEFSAGNTGGKILLSIVTAPSEEFLSALLAMQASSTDRLPALTATLQQQHAAAAIDGPFAKFLLDNLRSYLARPSSGTCVVVAVPDLAACDPSAAHPLEREHGRTLVTAVSALHGAPHISTKSEENNGNHHSNNAVTPPSQQQQRSASQQSAASTSSFPGGSGGGGTGQYRQSNSVSPVAGSVTPGFSLQRVGSGRSNNGANNNINSAGAPVATTSSSSLGVTSPTGGGGGGVVGGVLFGAAAGGGAGRTSSNTNNNTASNNSSTVLVDVDGLANQDQQQQQPQQQNPNDNSDHVYAPKSSHSVASNASSSSASRRPSAAMAAATAALRTARLNGVREYADPTDDGVSPNSVASSSSSSSGVSTPVKSPDVRSETARGPDPRYVAAQNHHQQHQQQQPVSSSASSSHNGGGAPTAIPLANGRRRPQTDSSGTGRGGNDDSGFSSGSGFNTGAGSGSMSSLFEKPPVATTTTTKKQQHHQREQPEQQQEQHQHNASTSSDKNNNLAALYRFMNHNNQQEQHDDENDFQQHHSQQHHHHDPRAARVSVLEAELGTVRSERDELGMLLRKMSVRLTRAQDALQAKSAEAATALARIAQLESDLADSKHQLMDATFLLQKESKEQTVSARLARKHAIERLEAKCGLEVGSTVRAASKERGLTSSSSARAAEEGGHSTKKSSNNKKTTTTSSNMHNRVHELDTNTAASGSPASLERANDKLRELLEQERQESEVLRAALLSAMEQREQQRRRRKTAGGGGGGYNDGGYNDDDDDEDEDGDGDASRNMSSSSSVFDRIAQALNRGIDIVRSRHSLATFSSSKSGQPLSVAARTAGMLGNHHHHSDPHNVSASSTSSNPTAAQEDQNQQQLRDRTSDALKKLTYAVERLQSDKVPDIPRVVASESDIIGAKFALTAELNRLKHLDGLILPFGSLLQQTIDEAERPPAAGAVADSVFAASGISSPQPADPQKKVASGRGGGAKHQQQQPQNKDTASARSNSSNAKKSRFIGAGAEAPLAGVKTHRRSWIN